MNKKTDGKDQKKIILYLGDDAGYWGTIKSRITQKLAGKAFEIHSVALKNTTNYQVVHLEVLKLAPQIIYLDFSTNLEFSLKLAHLLKRENSLKQTPVIGLVEKKKNIADCIFAGIEFIHLKCGEYHDIIYDGFFLAFPGEVQEPDFAKAQFERDATLICDMRLGFVTADSIHAEGNVNIAPDTTITINSEIPIKMIPSNKFICKEVTDFNLYYDYNT